MSDLFTSNLYVLFKFYKIKEDYKIQWIIYSIIFYNSLAKNIVSYLHSLHSLAIKIDKKKMKATDIM